MRNGKLLAGLYLVAFPVTVVGLVALLASQLAGQNLLPGVAVGLFVGGSLVIAGLSYALRAAVPAGSVKAGKDARVVAWNRLALGRELPGAWRAVRG
ncbi:hypothetical protein [Kribbella shirazensis]|uniref:Uncharacterized protein n=1 Tax=Kribbella shirazensis TaxID=1105143 RepID=A0A7X6A1D8_9ACTN|nr:hypothetical protein [Kribbella shirazensis]NIK57079.1 hypothetical protein [Kribbella shirazensis]